MSKYTPEQLKQAATIVLEDKKKNGGRSFQLVMQMCIITGMKAEDVLARIETLTHG